VAAEVGHASPARAYAVVDAPASSKRGESVQPVFDHDGDDRSVRRLDLPTVVANLRPATGRDVDRSWNNG